MGSVQTAARAWTSPTLDGQLYGEQAAIGAPANHFPTPGIGAGLMLAASARNVIAFRTSAAGVGRTAGAISSAARDNRHYTSSLPASSGRMIAEVLFACVIAVGAFGWFILLIRRHRRT